MHLEIEAKLLVASERTLGAIARLERLGQYRFRARGTQRLHSIYLDTPGMVLARHGVALRLRRLGRRWEITAKWSGAVAGDIHERPELTASLACAPRMPFVLPAGVIREQLHALVAGRPLRPILVTDIHRQRLDVLPLEGTRHTSALAELALDRVELRGPRDRLARAQYCEAEIEVLAGDRRDAARLARALRKQFALEPSRDSKFARGLALVYGAQEPVARVPSTTRRRIRRRRAPRPADCHHHRRSGCGSRA